MTQPAHTTTEQTNHPGLPESLTGLRGVGPALAEKLGRLGVKIPEDLLFVLPLRYEDRTRIAAIGSLQPGQRAVVDAFPRSPSAQALKRLATQVIEWPESSASGGQLEFFVERLINSETGSLEVVE